MIPSTLEAWNIDDIKHLLVQGYYEAETFDFKEMLPHSKDEDDKVRLFKTCCAFANSSGGFLVFGVKDAKAVKAGEPMESRLVGFNPRYDFPEQFGSYPQKCSPSITWDFKNPPIQLENGNVIHVVQIPRSWNAPHCFETQGKGSDHLRCFTKRTNKGNEDMSYEEIRMAFLQYYEKRLKLQLLQAELENIKNHAEKDLMMEPWDANCKFGMGEFDLTVVETVLSDTYTILAEHKELLIAIAEVRKQCKIINDLLRMFYPVAPLGWYGGKVPPSNVIEKHNSNIEMHCKLIIADCNRSLKLLEEIMVL
jgi:hypothetical protein